MIHSSLGFGRSSRRLTDFFMDSIWSITITSGWLFSKDSIQKRHSNPPPFVGDRLLSQDFLVICPQRVDKNIKQLSNLNLRSSSSIISGHVCSQGNHYVVAFSLRIYMHPYTHSLFKPQLFMVENHHVSRCFSSCLQIRVQYTVAPSKIWNTITLTTEISWTIISALLGGPSQLV